MRGDLPKVLEKLRIFGGKGISWDIDEHQGETEKNSQHSGFRQGRRKNWRIEILNWCRDVIESPQTVAPSFCYTIIWKDHPSGWVCENPSSLYGARMINWPFSRRVIEEERMENLTEAFRCVTYGWASGSPVAGDFLCPGFDSYLQLFPFFFLS
ncbi:hypothetical protein VNO77_16253 [Canavalia gladiata]|uniref:Uncharacterized protein n=1 Tax=Canavalia gladiata TaxID=3824 RepID=A0AAN9M036_CANGL